METAATSSRPPPAPDLSPFEADGDFRADFMFFLLRINGFVESLFWQKFFHGKTQRRKLRAYVEAYEEERLDNGHDPMDGHLKNALTWLGEKDRPPLDCYAADFRRLLGSLPEGVKKHQTDILEQEFGIFGGHAAFLKALEVLAKKRNALQHYAETKKWGPQNKTGQGGGETLSLLALYLLPKMRGMFIGSLRACARRLGREGELRPRIEQAEALFAHASREARENTSKVFAEKRRRDVIDKARRKSLEEKDNEYQNRIWQMCRQHVYRLGAFKRHYHFIGERALKDIEKMIGEARDARAAQRRITTDAAPDFRHDLESLYFLGIRINLVLHRFISRIRDSRIEAALQNCTSRTNWEKRLKRETDDALEKEIPDLLRIRDRIAHNGMFWGVKKAEGQDCAIDEVFKAVLAALPDRQTENDFYTAVLGLCRKHSRPLAFPSGADAAKTAPERIPTWSRQRRRKYLESGAYTVDKRPFLRPVVARWVVALNSARKSRNPRKKDDKKTG